MKAEFKVNDPVYVLIPAREGEVWPVKESYILSVQEDTPGCFWYLVTGQTRIVPEDRIRPRAEETRALEAA